MLRTSMGIAQLLNEYLCVLNLPLRRCYPALADE